MESTDGLTRGLEVLDTGRPISVPVGKEKLWPGVQCPVGILLT